jgi:hypothetical protein
MITPGSPCPTQRRRLGPPAWSAREFWAHLPRHIAMRLVVELARLHTREAR